MKIFKEDTLKKEDIKKNEITQEKIVFPTSLEDVKTFSLDKVLISTLQDIVDIKDYKEFMSVCGYSFFDKNNLFLESLKNLGDEDIEKIWYIINNFLIYNSLGTSQIIIDTQSKEIYIKHFDSPFVFLSERTKGKKVCEFLSAFYSKILSRIFDENIKIEEQECKNEGKSNYCLFKMV